MCPETVHLSSSFSGSLSADGEAIELKIEKDQNGIVNPVSQQSVK